MNKKSPLSAFLTAILISGLVLASAIRFVTVGASTDVSGIPKPSVPEFTVELVGETIEVKIKNHPFTPYWMQDSNGNNWTINFFYNIRINWNRANWITLYRALDGYPTQSDEQYTVISYVWGGDADTVLGTKMIKLSPGAQIDFQAEAMIGYVHRVQNPNATSLLDMFPWVFTGETSGWSETRTITLPTFTPSPTSSPSPTPTPKLIPEDLPQTLEFEAILGAVIIVTVLGAGLVFLIYLIKRK